MLILHYSPPPLPCLSPQRSRLAESWPESQTCLVSTPDCQQPENRIGILPSRLPFVFIVSCPVLALCDSFICLGLPLLCPRIAWNSNLILKRDGRGALPLVHYTEWKKDSVCLGGGGGGSLCVSLANLWDCGSRLRFAFL